MSFDFLGASYIGLYILDGHNVVEERDLMRWAEWFETADRIVARTEHELFTVSTVFLGLDHRHFGRGPPIVFESMLFVGGDGLDTERYSSWDDAETGHKAMVRKQLDRLSGVPIGRVGVRLPPSPKQTDRTKV